MTYAPVDQMVMVVHMYIRWLLHKSYTVDLSNGVLKGTYISKPIPSHYDIAHTLPLSHVKPNQF